MTAPVLTLRAGSGGDPVFCLPPGTGLGWQYTQVTRFVPESSSVHAVQAPFIAGASEAPTDIRELARRYAELLIETEPSEAYRLVGWSFGGNVALALAAELQSRGKRVGPLVLIDSAAKVPEQYLERNAEMTSATAALLSLGIPVAPEDMSLLSTQDAITRIRATENFMADFDSTTIEAVVHSSAWSLEVMLAAQYPTFDGDVLFVRAVADRMRAAALTADAAEQWSPFIQGDFRMIEVDAAHADLLDRATVELYGHELERELAR
ncbi:thioesterase domain-containing protein [Nocardia callitridis]